MKRDSVWLMLALLILSGGFLLQQSGLLDGQREVAVHQSDCDLRQGGCELEISGQPVRFLIEPQDIEILQPLTISLIMPENATFLPEKVSVQFEGVNMDMGYNRVFLEPVRPGYFQAKGMLPACTAETMHWLIHLLVQDLSGIRDYQFRLSTKSR